MTREGLSSEEEAARNSRAKDSASSRGSEDTEKAREAGEAGSQSLIAQVRSLDLL